MGPAILIICHFSLCVFISCVFRSLNFSSLDLNSIKPLLSTSQLRQLIRKSLFPYSCWVYLSFPRGNGVSFNPDLFTSFLIISASAITIIRVLLLSVLIMRPLSSVRLLIIRFLNAEGNIPSRRTATGRFGLLNSFSTSGSSASLRNCSISLAAQFHSLFLARSWSFARSWSRWRIPRARCSIGRSV